MQALQQAWQQVLHQQLPVRLADETSHPEGLRPQPRAIPTRERLREIAREVALTATQPAACAGAAIDEEAYRVTTGANPAPRVAQPT